MFTGCSVRSVHCFFRSATFFPFRRQLTVHMEQRKQVPQISNRRGSGTSKADVEKLKRRTEYGKEVRDYAGRHPVIESTFFATFAARFNVIVVVCAEVVVASDSVALVVLPYVSASRSQSKRWAPRCPYALW